MHLDFIIAGFSKCGTTSLCNMLGSHPKIFFPPRFKEPRFFNNPDYAMHWNWYRDLFYTAPANALFGEGSVTYSEAEFAQISIKRIVRHFPQIKIILIARDPVDRIESSFREMHNSGTDWGIEAPFNLEEAMEQVPNMLEDSKYWKIEDLFLQHLPKENLLVLFQEDLKEDSNKIIEKCFSFLKVASDLPIIINEKKLNRGANKFFDTKKLRMLRDKEVHPRAAEASYLISTKVENQFLPQLGLKESFGNKSLDWSSNARKILVQALGNGPKLFLDRHGKDKLTWSRYTSFFNKFNI